jgi:hypothetical protein
VVSDKEELMTIKEKVSRRFKQLEIMMNDIIPDRPTDRYWPIKDHALWMQWTTSVLGLLGQVFGETSPYYSNFADAVEARGRHGDATRSSVGVFLSAKDTFEGDFLFDLAEALSDEILGDFVNLAKTALDEGHKDVGAALACAAIEDALKRIAEQEGLDTTGKDMSHVIGLLKSKGLVSGRAKPLLDRMPTFRNFAMHADWASITPAETGTVIGLADQLLLVGLSALSA